MTEVAEAVWVPVESPTFTVTHLVTFLPLPLIPSLITFLPRITPSLIITN